MGFSLASLFRLPSKTTEKRTRGAELGEELYSMLTDDDRKADDAAVLKIIEELEVQPGTCNEDFLYGSPWRVVWKTKTEWQRFFDPFDAVADIRAYQWFRKDGSVTNIVQAAGDKLYFTADGQSTPCSDSTKLPYQVDVDVSQGSMNVFGLKIPLGFIKGKGRTIVVYIDPKIRVFRTYLSEGTAVQIKVDDPVPV